jgi:pilus assembly protein Flp/PilA
VTAFARNESGATAIEYALIAGLISIIVVASVANVGSAVTGLFMRVVNAMP